MVHEVRRLFTLLAGLKIEFLDFLWMVVKRATHCPSVDTRVIHDGGSGSISIPLCLRKRRTGSSFHVEFLTCILEETLTKKKMHFTAGFVSNEARQNSLSCCLFIHGGENLFIFCQGLFFCGWPSYVVSIRSKPNEA